MNVIKANQMKSFGARQNGIYEVTQEFASAIVEWGNLSNRPVKKKQVKILRDAMNMGQWKLNGERLIIGKTSIFSAQHRLLAAAGAETPPLMEFYFNSDESAEMVNSIDQGVPRTLGDNLNFLLEDEYRGMTTLIARIAALALRFENTIESKGGKKSTQENWAWVDGHREFLESIKSQPFLTNKNHTLLFSKAELCTAAYLIANQWGYLEAWGFINRVVKGLNITTEDDPVGRLRNYIASVKQGGSGSKKYSEHTRKKGTGYIRTICVLKAFNKQKKNQTISRFELSESDFTIQVITKKELEKRK